MKKLILIGLLGLIIAPCAPMEAAPKKRVAASLRWPTFRQNAAKKSSPNVTAIQYLLRSRGVYKSRPDGIFGAQTAASVRAFQRKNGLKADGIVSSQTFAKLIVPLKRGSRGDAVRALQTLLRTSHGHEGQLPYADMKVDGVFGFETEHAVRNVQDEAGVGGDSIAIDGIVGAQTWWIMLGGQYLNP